MRAFDADEHQVAVLDNLQPLHQHGGRAGGVRVAAIAGLVLGEPPEIAHPDERVRRLAHRGQVQRVLHPPHVGFGEGGATPRQLIDVAPGHGIVARVEAVRHRCRLKHVDIGRQLVVDAPYERGRRQIGHDVEMRDLRDGVDAGVGAAGAIQLEIAATRHGAHRLVDLALNRACVLLNLPAAVARSGVLDRQLEPHDSSSLPPRSCSAVVVGPCMCQVGAFCAPAFTCRFAPGV